MHKYLAAKSPTFRTSVKIKNKDEEGKTVRIRCKFENGIYSTDNDEIAAALDKALAESVGLSSHFRKVDMAQAAAAVKAHMSKVTQLAHKGSMASDALAKLKRGAIPASGNALEESAPNNPEALTQLQKAMESDANDAAGNDTVLITETKTEPSLAL